MVKITYVIQNKAFGTEEFTKHCGPYLILDKPVLPYIDYSSYYIPRGSVEFCTEFFDKYSELLHIPNLLHLERYACAKYYPYFVGQNILLNEDFSIVSYIDFKNNFGEFFNEYKTDRLFIRPNSGRKIFTGTTIGSKWTRKELDIIESLPSTQHLNDFTLILVSPAKNIESEARFFYSNDNYTFSSYNGIFPEEKLPQAIDLIKKCDMLYRPDIFYTMDVCVTNDEVKLVELNSFVSAGLYEGMSIPFIIDEINKEYSEL